VQREKRVTDAKTKRNGAPHQGGNFCRSPSREAMTPRPEDRKLKMEKHEASEEEMGEVKKIKKGGSPAK